MIKIIHNISFILFLSLNFNLLANDKLPEPITWKNDLKEWIFGEDKIANGEHLFTLDTPYRALDAESYPSLLISKYLKLKIIM